MDRIPPALKPIVYIPGLMYQVLIRARNWAYASGLRPQRHLPGPVISIGNVTMGGSGKTPLVIHIAGMLSALGFNTAVLTRGYARQNPKTSLVLPPGEPVATPALTLGDEPALMRRKLPEAWMGISRDRFLAGNLLAQQNASCVYLLDDGFQHRRLYRDLDIVILDSSQPLAGNHPFPLGTLREPLSELRRAHALIVNGASDAHAFEPMEALLRRLVPKAKLFHCTQSIDGLLPFSSWEKGESLSGFRESLRPAYLVSAIGNPQRFHRDLRCLGIDIRGARSFPDHYCLEQKDWAVCRREAERCGAETLIITEKDAIKITQSPEFPLMVAIQKMELSDPVGFTKLLLRCTEKYAGFTDAAKK